MKYERHLISLSGNYYEHIVRDERDLRRIRQYIHDNPASWAMDMENPDKRG